MEKSDRKADKSSQGSSDAIGCGDGGSQNGTGGNDGGPSSDDGSINEINEPTQNGTTSQAGTKNAGQSKRGRPSGNGNGKSGEKAGTTILKKNESILATQLIGVHKMLGIVSGYGQIMEIDERESEQLAAALIGIMDQYKIKVNPKMLATGQLLGTMTAIYTPKIIFIVAYNKQRKETNTPAADNSQATVGGNVVLG